METTIVVERPPHAPQQNTGLMYNMTLLSSYTLTIRKFLRI